MHLPIAFGPSFLHSAGAELVVDDDVDGDVEGDVDGEVDGEVDGVVEAVLRVGAAVLMSSSPFTQVVVSVVSSTHSPFPVSTSQPFQPVEGHCRYSYLSFLIPPLKLPALSLMSQEYRPITDCESGDRNWLFMFT